MSTLGDGYCSDVISTSQIEQLMDSLQHAVAMDDDDDEVQLVDRAAQQQRWNGSDMVEVSKLVSK